MIDPSLGTLAKRIPTHGAASVEELYAVLRTDFFCFFRKCFNELNGGTCYQDNFHTQAIAHHLELCRQGDIKRLIINVQPRSLKTLVTSIAWPAFILGHNPACKIMHCTYSSDFAMEIARDFRRIVNSSWYRRLFPAMRIYRDVDSELETTRGGGRLALSIGGSVTGRGCDILIIDDLLKAEDAFSRTVREAANDYLARTLYSRLNDQAKGVIVLVAQRLHEEDLPGRLLKQGGWEILKLPSIATESESIPVGNSRFHTRRPGDLLQPARESRQELDRTRAIMGGMVFQAQYQQAPIPEAGNIVQLKWFRQYDVLSPPTTGSQIVQSWDTAIKGGDTNSYSVCTTWRLAGGSHYLIDVLRRQCDYPALLQLVVGQRNLYDADTLLIEDKASGSTLIQDLPHHYQIDPIAIRPEKDKRTRLAAVSSLIEQGLVHLPREAPWLSEFLEEILGFPQRRFDDQVDSFSQYLGWWRNRNRSYLDVFWT